MTKKQKISSKTLHPINASNSMARLQQSFGRFTPNCANFECSRNSEWNGFNASGKSEFLIVSSA